jgi:hypothetical protein
MQQPAAATGYGPRSHVVYVVVETDINCVVDGEGEGKYLDNFGFAASMVFPVVGHQQFEMTSIASVRILETVGIEQEKGG